MKLSCLAISVMLLGGLGLAAATPPAHSDESALTVDLWAANHIQLFVKCAQGKDLLRCASPSVWQNTNTLKGLQTSATDDDGAILPDHPLLA